MLPFTYEELNKVVTVLYHKCHAGRQCYMFAKDIQNDYLKRFKENIELAKIRSVINVLYTFFKEEVKESEYTTDKGRSIIFITEMEEMNFKPKFEKYQNEIKYWLEYSDKYDDLERRISELEKVVNRDK